MELHLGTHQSINQSILCSAKHSLQALRSCSVLFLYHAGMLHDIPNVMGERGTCSRLCHVVQTVGQPLTGLTVSCPLVLLGACIVVCLQTSTILHYICHQSSQLIAE